MTPNPAAAIARVQLAYDALQQRSPGEKLYVAYSGGKDSDAVLEVCRMAVGDGALEVHYHATGIDPPEVVKHIKYNFKAWKSTMECHFDKPTENMHDLIVRKGPPRQNKRYCCEKLKEGKGHGRVVITGVRWAESQRRAETHGVLTIMSKNKELRASYTDDNNISRRIVEHCTTRSRLTINPIVDWHNTWPLAFLQDRGRPYCSLYDEGYTRLGCIACPMSGGVNMRNDLHRWPHMCRYYMRAFADMLAVNPAKYAKYGWETAEDVYHWWVRDGFAKGQIGMFDGEEMEG